MLQKINAVNKVLDAVVPLRNPTKIHEAMRYSFLSGGKRICSIVCIAFVDGNESIAMPSACALEMVHAACLMHDYLSCTDSDDLRRWKPSNHKVFGEYVIVLAGCALVTCAFEHIVTTIVGVKLEKILRVIGELARLIGLEGVVVGQVDDLESGGQDQSDMGFEKLEYIHFHKTTAALEASAIAGAMLEKKSVAITCMT
ncbi:geranylgeranyl pyrophosphate synthase, chloroplastic-like, partial [Olea europaea subsp. europaea]